MTDSIEQAENLVRSGQAAEAMPLLNTILAAQPDLIRAHSACAAALVRLDRPQEALKHLEVCAAGVDRFPNPVRARVGIAQRFEKAGDLQRADDLVREAIVLQPGNLELVVKRGDLLARASRWTEALELYRKALDTVPDHADILSSAGIAAQQAGKASDAVDLYRRSLASSPEQPLVHHNLVAALLELGQPNDAFEVCEDWIARKPADIEAMSFYALLLAETGNRDHAEKWFDYDRLVHSYSIDAPSIYSDINAFNRSLEAHILAHPDLETPPVDHPTWHHPALKIGSDINQGESGPVRDLETVMHDAVERYFDHTGAADGHPFLSQKPQNFRISAWAAVLECEGNQLPHIHMDGFLSGCYYITIPPEVSAESNGADGVVKGGFEIGQPPDELHIATEIETRTIKPSEGLMVLFPAYLYHGTIPFKSNQRRICIAFDVIPSTR